MSTPEAPEFVPLSIEELQVFFPQYEILSFIAAGGMGAVYLANQKSIDRRVAIKVLPRELSSDEEFSAQFRAEAKVMSRLNHPNLIGFFDFGEVDGMLFIVMEFVDGKSLHHSAHGEVIDQDTALELAIGITEGVTHAHKAGILHRDIKPANILLDQEAFPKLGDFGLARPVEESEEGKVIFGTPGYTAPEVMENVASIDERSDIFSIGAILYELLIGHLPEDAYRAPSQIRQVDPAFDKVIKKAIAFNPDLRYPDTNAFLEELKQIKLNHERDQTINTIQETKEQPNAAASPSVTARPTYTPKKAAVKKSTGLAKMLATVVILGALLALAIPLLREHLKEVKAAENAEPKRVVKVIKVEDIKPGKVSPSVGMTTSANATPSIEALDKVALALVNKDFTQLPKDAIVHEASQRAFFLYHVAQDWDTSKMVSAKYGGYLACADDEEIKELLVEEMQTNAITSAWLGGGSVVVEGETQYVWGNGDSLGAGSIVGGSQGNISLESTGQLSANHFSMAKPFLICWDLKGHQKGRDERQFFRLRSTARATEPTLPIGAVMTENKIYALHKNRLNREEAYQVAKKYGAQLADPIDATEGTLLSHLTASQTTKGNGVWMSGVILTDGTVKWRDNQSSHITGWLQQPEPSTEENGILIMNDSSQVGWMPTPSSHTAYGAVLEWSRSGGSITDIEHGADDEEEREMKATGYHLELLQKAKVANAARKEQRVEAYQKAVKDAKWELSLLMRGLTDNRKELTEAPLKKYIAQIEKAGKLVPPSRSLPSSVNDTLSPILNKQEEADMIYRADLLKLKTAMQERLKKQSEEDKKSGKLNEAQSLSKAAAMIFRMGADRFQKYLDRS